MIQPGLPSLWDFVLFGVAVGVGAAIGVALVYTVALCLAARSGDGGCDARAIQQEWDDGIDWDEWERDVHS